ncbi:Chromatin structure-remodeling complex subunit-like protein [Hapsidospora chrysogenum ATCC 11550]|uniref:Chromatin structure-remodeling complex subunit-like protein n=1 Tax=Hapsidospora chrysogenum (strain ATCC 11550 / CBS 779.69 / DSM 880 / IAM 14645 / JCM 23072 / IMI 49137) TaxID=857340 RepID=A0A086TCX1_HAPC1|nr:Chromatin structure-remodeling complex subunit-like protein [Hapsidospora chrysogenum ATCC 11550]
MERSKPQAFLSSYAPRLRTYNNSLLTPVLPSSTPAAPLSRTTKRGTTIINYAEDGYDELEYDSDDPRRRPTGLRSLRKEDSAAKFELGDRAGKDTKKPVDVQGIWRDWMVGKSRFSRSDQQNAAQASLPLTLIPIRIDLDIPSFVPPAPLPPPNTNSADITLPQYRPQEPTVPYKLRDIFCWNLHETLITTDQFAQTLAQDLDLPNKHHVAAEISKQIRTQLEEYSGVALHPLFHAEAQAPAQPQTAAASGASGAVNGGGTPKPQQSSALFKSRDASPSSLAKATSRPGTPAARTGGRATPSQTQDAGVPAPKVTAEATPILPDSDDYNPDDTYRCIVNLNLNLSSTLYTDKFEWSLLHPPGTAEAFAKTTCTDLGLTGEWIPAMTHAIYEAVLRLKKEACEAGGIVAGWGGLQQELPNDAAHGTEAGWRYDPDHLADDWEPKVEILSKEEMEKREGDRERQVRRLRRETARFSSTTGLLGGTPFGGGGVGGLVEVEEERMGRGERSKKKRRFRSLSPVGRSGTPGGRGTPDAGGYGGGGSLAEQERATWRCSHCRVWGSSVWAVRDGPAGPRSLCANCGLLYERDRKLPRQTKNLHLLDIRTM